jgi:hypothetical protein
MGVMFVTLSSDVQSSVIHLCITWTIEPSVPPPAMPFLGKLPPEIRSGIPLITHWIWQSKVKTSSFSLSRQM